MDLETHRVLLANAVSNGASSGWAWYDSQIDLMNEHMVYGSWTADALLRELMKEHIQLGG
jgi:hypothetical protein